MVTSFWSQKLCIFYTSFFLLILHNNIKGIDVKLNLDDQTLFTEKVSCKLRYLRIRLFYSPYYLKIRRAGTGIF